MALLGLVLSGCAGPKDVPDSGVIGRVWVGPMCPVVQPGVDCPDQPLEADLEIVDAHARVVARARSGADGTYRIPLATGSYVLTPLSPGQSSLPFASPLPFEVPAGTWVSLDVHYDSGIR
jgi:hypothetical protein